MEVGGAFKKVFSSVDTPHPNLPPQGGKGGKNIQKAEFNRTLVGKSSGLLFFFRLSSTADLFLALIFGEIGKPHNFVAGSIE